MSFENFQKLKKICYAYCPKIPNITNYGTLLPVVVVNVIWTGKEAGICSVSFTHKICGMSNLNYWQRLQSSKCTR